MSKLPCFAFLLLASLPAFVACSPASGGSEPDFDALEQRMDAPQGLFSPDQQSAVATAVRTKGSLVPNVKLSTLSTTEGASATKSFPLEPAMVGALSLQPQAGSAFSDCSSLTGKSLSGSCACPDGGTFDYAFTGVEAARRKEPGPIVVTLRVGMSACANKGSTIDGQMFVRVRGQREANGTVTETALTFIADVTGHAAGQTLSLQAEVVRRGADAFVAVPLESGTVVAQQTAGNGGFRVRDRSGTWTCTASNVCSKN